MLQKIKGITEILQKYIFFVTYIKKLLLYVIINVKDNVKFWKEGKYKNGK